MASRTRVLLFLAMLPAVGQAQQPTPGALQPAYLNGMPSVQRVRDTIRGRDHLDTATRQIAAFHQLGRILEKASGGRVYDNTLTPDEKRLMTAYAAAKRDLAAPIEQSLSQRERADWFAKRARLETSDEFRDELLEALFATQWVRWYRETTLAADQARGRKSERPQRESPVSAEARLWVAWSGLASFVISILLLPLTLWRETRPFAVDSGDIGRVRAGFTRYTVQSATGTLTDVSETRYVTKTSSYDPDGKLISVGEHIETTRACTLVSIEKPGEHHSLTNLAGYAPVYEGDAASLVWLSRPGREGGRYFLLLNHTKGSFHSLETVLERKIFAPWLWPVLPLAWVGIGLALLPPFSDHPMIMWFAVLVAILAFLVWRPRAARRRAAAYWTAGEKPLIDRLNEKADRLFGRRLLEPQ